MIQIGLSQVLFYTIEFISISLAVIDFTDHTKKLDEYIREKVDDISDWISNNPIKQYVKDGFRVSIQYSIGMFVGGLLFTFLIFVLEGGIIMSVVAIVLLFFAAKSVVTRRQINGCFIAMIWIVYMLSQIPEFDIAIASLIPMIIILSILQIFGPVLMAYVYYIFLLFLRIMFGLLSRPKKGIVGTISFIIAIGNPVANHVFGYMK